MANCITVKETHDFNFNDLMYHCWSGAIDTLKEIEKHGKEDEFMNYLWATFIDDEAVDMTELNDFIWFEDEQIFEDLGIYEDEEEDEDDLEDEKEEGEEKDE